LAKAWSLVRGLGRDTREPLTILREVGSPHPDVAPPFPALLGAHWMEPPPLSSSVRYADIAA